MTSPITISFVAPADRINANDRTHYRVKAKQTQEWRGAAAAAACHLDPLPEPAEHACHVVHVTFPVRDRRRRDPANWHPTVKAIVDGLTDAELWPDDNSRWVRTTEPTFTQGRDLPVTVTITPGLRADHPIGQAWAQLASQLETIAAQGEPR